MHRDIKNPPTLVYMHSYTSQDRLWRDDLMKQLTIAERQGQIRQWHRDLIPAGEPIETVLLKELTQATAILILLSPALFNDSLFLWFQEQQEMLLQNSAVRLIPILLYPVLGWEKAFGEERQTLPRNRKPLSSWKNKLDGCYEIGQELLSIISPISYSPQQVETLYSILSKDGKGKGEFAHIVDLLLFHRTQKSEQSSSNFGNVVNEYSKLAGSEFEFFRRDSAIDYEYRFFSSPLQTMDRRSIEETLKKLADTQRYSKLEKWILITPEDFIIEVNSEDEDDNTWFKNLRQEFHLKCELEHWGNEKLLSLFLETLPFCLFYYPELIDNGVIRKKNIENIRRQYDENLLALYRDIQFVGMSVYKPQATTGVPMEHIYIPLKVIEESENEQSATLSYVDPLSFLSLGTQQIILGDPGSGKSTLLRFLTLASISRSLQERYKTRSDNRLSILVTLRRYADELKTRTNLSLVDYIEESTQADFTLKGANAEFFEYYLKTGETLLFFDGLDELPSSHFKQIIRDRIRSLITTYPGNTIVVSSRIVGYDYPFRFDKKEFRHYRLAKLQLPEIEQFVKDWYSFRIENEREREANIKDLIRILNDESYVAIRDLAENPLLLTIITLIHRIDAVLPDERIVLYQKCTETLLNTWQTWKFHDVEARNKGKVERRNRRRIEAIAYWIHNQSGGTKKSQQSIVHYDDLLRFLTRYIIDNEKSIDSDNDPEDLANDFLEFVKKRAGLLIEVGDSRYSFVHLTFQEYLTSSYIITMGEKDGVTRIWEIIKGHINDPRWHEIIRLLVAGLKNNESQQFIINHLLSGKKEASEHVMQSRLLNGLLLDGVESAEICKKEILEHLLLSACVAADVEQLRLVNSLLRELITKENVDEEVLWSSFLFLWESAIDEMERITLALIGFSLELPKIRLDVLSKSIFAKETREANLFKLFFSEDTITHVNEIIMPEIELLWALQDSLLLLSPSGSFIAATLSSLGSHITAKRTFEELMVALCRGPLNGSFKNFVFNSSNIAFEGGLDGLLNLVRGIVRRGISGSDDVLDVKVIYMTKIFHFTGHGFSPRLNHIWPLSKEAESERGRILDHAIKQAQALSRDLNRAQMRSRRRLQPIGEVRSLAQARVQIQAQNLGRNLNWAFNQVQATDWIEDWNQWHTIIDDINFSKFFLDLLCDTFSLQPRTQWHEALRLGFLPNIPKRICLYDKNAWQQLESAFVNDNVDETEIYNAAWLLLLDAWFYIFGYYTSGSETLFERLSELTSIKDAPPLHIARCIRALAYGDISQRNELISLLKSQDVKYRSIFEKCFWYVAFDK